VLHKFSPSQKVGVEGDPEFVGVITGPLYSPENEFTGKWVVGVSQPGSSGLRGQASIEESRLVALDAPPAYIAPRRGVNWKEKARYSAPSSAPAEQSPARE